MSGGVAKCLGGFGADLCNTHLPLGTGATHGGGEETHVVGVGPDQAGCWGKSTGSGGEASAEESGPGHLVSLGLLLPNAAQPSPSSGSGTPWHPQYS